MTAVEVPTVPVQQWWATTKTAAKTCVVILAVIGATHITEPMRAEAAPAAVVKTVKGASQGKG